MVVGHISQNVNVVTFDIKKYMKYFSNIYKILSDYTKLGGLYFVTYGEDVTISSINIIFFLFFIFGKNYFN